MYKLQALFSVALLAFAPAGDKAKTDKTKADEVETDEPADESSEAQPESEDAPAEDGQGSYAKAVAELEAANAAVTEDPDLGPGRLAKAILAFSDHAPELAVDPATRALRIEAMLNLARLQSGDAKLATATMDMAIRESHGEPLPVRGLGPRLEQLYFERLDALNQLGTASIRVDCTVPCRIYVDGREKPRNSGPLHLGSHQLWVENDGGLYPVFRSAEKLETAGETLVIEYGPPPEPEPVVVEPRRKRPLWGQVSLIVLGTAMIAGGATMLSFHGVCPNAMETECDNVFDSRALGTAIVGLGGVSLGAGSVWLGIERKGGGDDLQVSLGWRTQF